MNKDMGDPSGPGFRASTEPPAASPPPASIPIAGRDPLLYSASNVAVLMKTILRMSDEVKRGRSPLDTQGRLLRLQSSIQKNRSRIQAVCDWNELNAAQGIEGGEKK